MTKNLMSNRMRALRRPIIINNESGDDVRVLQFKKYCDLCRHFDIDPLADDGPWQLTTTLFPGFQVKLKVVREKKAGGRPRKLTHVQFVKLQVEMRKSKANGLPYEKTAYALACGPGFGGVNPQTLRRTFNRYKKDYDDPVTLAQEFIAAVTQQAGAFSP